MGSVDDATLVSVSTFMSISVKWRIMSVWLAQTKWSWWATRYRAKRNDTRLHDSRNSKVTEGTWNIPRIKFYQPYSQAPSQMFPSNTSTLLGRLSCVVFEKVVLSKCAPLDIRKIWKVLSGNMNTRNALQTAVGIMNRLKYLWSNYNAGHRWTVLGPVNNLDVISRVYHNNVSLLWNWCHPFAWWQSDRDILTNYLQAIWFS